MLNHHTSSAPDKGHAKFQRVTQDIGNIVDLGHVNVRVADQQRALIFYVMGLGLTRDPYLTVGVDNAWINVGTSQFHLPVGSPQLLRGVAGLVMPDLDALVARLDAIEPRLRDTKFAFVRAGSQVDVTCPWGNRIRVHAPDVERFGRMLLGMPYVEIDAAPGSAAGIARFYAEIFHAPSSTGHDGASEFARIAIGPSASLIFRESRQALPPYDGHHVQITVADFSGVHGRLLERGLVTEESNESQYRFQDIIDLDTDDVLATLEHEVRSMRHPMFARSLVNRNPAVTNNAYAAGHEDAALQLPPA